MTGPDGRRPGDARAQAVLRRFAAAFGAHGLPVPVDAIALDLLGLYVCELDDLGASGVLVPAERRVYLDAGECRESPGRRRFTLAHEIGHWVCQCREGRSAAPAQILCRDDELGPPVVHRLEREANVFAADLLMPEALVVDAHRGSPDVPALAARFGVSEPAMAWRLFNIGLGPRPPGAEVGLTRPGRA